MKVLVVGGGGREHALAWKLSRSKKVKKLYAAPGNPGIAQIGTLVDILATDIQGLARFAESKKIDLTVVGPEVPLALGIVDEFERRGLKIFGPNKKASRIEADKAFAREFMYRFGLPAPKFQVYTSASGALKYLKTVNKFPVVVKAAGLAAGKGVSVVSSRKEYEKKVDEIKRSSVIIQSLAFPGLGLSRINQGKPHWLRGVAGYGCIAGAIIYNQKAVSSYDDYLGASDPKKIDEYYNNSVRQDNLSEIFMYAAIGIWVTDIIWTIVGSSEKKNSPNITQLGGISLGGSYTPNSKMPLITLKYNF